MRTLQDILDSDIANLETEIRPASHHHGLHSLPPELMGRIFKYLAMLNASPKTLSAVSKGFSNLSKATPEFWQNFSDYDTLDEVERKLRLIKDRPMNVYIGVGINLLPMEQQVALPRFCQLTDRWVTLTEDMAYHPWTASSVFLHEQTVVFPSLVSLDIESNGFLSKLWSFPVLMELKTSFNSLPEQPSFFANLTKLEVNAPRLSTRSAEDLLHSLAYAQKLEYLYVELADRRSPNPYSAIDESLLVNLPALSKLHIVMDILMYEDEAVCRMVSFMGALQAPKLCDIHIKYLHSTAILFDAGDIQQIFHSVVQLETVQCVFLDLETEERLTVAERHNAAADLTGVDTDVVDQCQMFIDLFLRGMDNLNTLNLRLPEYMHSFDFGHLPNLPHFLRIEGCPEVAATSLLALRRLSEQPETQARLQALDVITETWGDDKYKRSVDTLIHEETVGQTHFSWKNIAREAK